jgi:tRNA (mo5U34)-methyltransferase
MAAGEHTLQEEIQSLGTWFHNLRLPVDGAVLGGAGGHGRANGSNGRANGRVAGTGAPSFVQTAPTHPLGDFPNNFWRHFQHAVPRSLRGKTVLDIGCNAGFYSFEMKRRGAARVTGIDHDPAYLAQAELARRCLGLDVEFRRLEAYDVDRLGEQFDLVIFMGVFYHLRHPLYALEKVAKLVRPGGRLLFQTMERGLGLTHDWEKDYPITEEGIFFDERFPRMFFVEHRYAGDATNWWIPNSAATQAMVRSCGMKIAEQPCREVYVCEPAGP